MFGGFPPPPVDVDQIYQTARELTRALDEIVWAVNPRHDTFDSLVTYLGRFAQTFLSSAGIRCRLDVPVQLPRRGRSPRRSATIYFSRSKSLNNVAKHARATETRISLQLLRKGFLLEVIDNGCGFDHAARSRRSGARAHSGGKRSDEHAGDTGRTGRTLLLEDALAEALAYVSRFIWVKPAPDRSVIKTR